jgi:hypothetical protein
MPAPIPNRLRKNYCGTVKIPWLARLGQQENRAQDAQKGGLLTRPTLAVISPARPESAKTASSPWDAPYPMQGRNSSIAPRFTFHASRFTVPVSEARTPLADFFSILLIVNHSPAMTDDNRVKQLLRTEIPANVWAGDPVRALDERTALTDVPCVSPSRRK